MGFKLVRTDLEEPSKIQLPLGTHLLGRGKFLDCEDKRVSRKHCELEVTNDSVKLKQLHQNPSFYIKKGTDETQILKLNCVTDLSNGDKFGLLPSSYWYELLHCTEADITRLSPEQSNPETVVDTNGDETETVSGGNSMERLNDSQEPLNFDLDENADNETRESQLMIQGAESPSLARPESPSLARPESPSYTQTKESPSMIKISTENQQSSTLKYEVTSPAVPSDEEPETPSLKRCHSPEADGEPKKVKTEPVEVKQEPEDVKPGPSNDQGASKADDNVKADEPAAPAANPPGPGRERCMYGANCYRKNPQHKAQFSHPADADWGPGERGACPWGRGCARTDPRHWRDHDHPPGTVQPQPGPRPAGKKRKQRHDSDDDTPIDDLIVTGKRKRKTVQNQDWSGSESENEDPFQTDESDEWQPGSEAENTQSQGYTQDLLD